MKVEKNYTLTITLTQNEASQLMLDLRSAGHLGRVRSEVGDTLFSVILQMVED